MSDNLISTTVVNVRTGQKNIVGKVNSLLVYAAIVNFVLLRVTH